MSDVFLTIQPIFRPARQPHESQEEYRIRQKQSKTIIKHTQTNRFIHKSVIFTKGEDGIVTRPEKGTTFKNPEKNSFKSRTGHKAERKALKHVKQQLRNAS